MPHDHEGGEWVRAGGGVSGSARLVAVGAEVVERVHGGQVLPGVELDRGGIHDERAFSGGRALGEAREPARAGADRSFREAAGRRAKHVVRGEVGIGDGIEIARVPRDLHVPALVAGHVVNAGDERFGAAEHSEALDPLGVDVVVDGVAGVVPGDDRARRAVGSDRRKGLPSYGAGDRDAVAGPQGCA